MSIQARKRGRIGCLHSLRKGTPAATILPRVRFKTQTECNNKACILEHVYIEKGASVNKRRRNIPVAAYAFDTNFINHYSCSSVFSLKGYYHITVIHTEALLLLVRLPFRRSHRPWGKQTTIMAAPIFSTMGVSS